jgi:hypothetical protein
MPRNGIRGGRSLEFRNKNELGVGDNIDNDKSLLSSNER